VRRAGAPDGPARGPTATLHQVPESDSGLDIDEIVETLRARISARRRNGDYPPGLEAQLERHFRQIIDESSWPTTDVEGLYEAVRRLDTGIGFSPERIETTSRLPGGSAVHSAVGKAVSRQTLGILQQVQEFAQDVKVAMTKLATAIDTETSLRQRLMRDTLSGILDRLAILDELVATVSDLDARLAALEARGAEPSEG
jgi:hypothetical protein